MKLLIINRDGVINEDTGEFVRSPEKWRPIPGSLRAITRANCAGYHVVLASDHPSLALGRMTIYDLAVIHQKLIEKLSAVGGQIDAIFFCPHSPEDKCACRKPHPGMLHDISSRFCTSLEGVPYIGDSIDDVLAARSAGADPVLVRTGKWPQETKQDVTGVPIYDNLAAAIDVIVSDYYSDA